MYSDFPGVSASESVRPEGYRRAHWAMKHRDGYCHPGFPHTVRGNRCFTALSRIGRHLMELLSSRGAGLFRGLRVLAPTLRRYLVWGRSKLSTCLMLLGLLVQLVFLMLLWELVDLVLSLMELWVELAAKHLRITLDETP